MLRDLKTVKKVLHILENLIPAKPSYKNFCNQKSNVAWKMGLHNTWIHVTLYKYKKQKVPYFRCYNLYMWVILFLVHHGLRGTAHKNLFFTILLSYMKNQPD